MTVTTIRHFAHDTRVALVTTESYPFRAYFQVYDFTREQQMGHLVTSEMYFDEESAKAAFDAYLDIHAIPWEKGVLEYDASMLDPEANA